MLQKRASDARFIVVLIIFCLFELPIAAFAGAANAGPSEAQRVQQVISRLTFGARPGDADRIAQVGVDTFIQQQLSPETIDDSALDKRLQKLPTLGLST